MKSCTVAERRQELRRGGIASLVVGTLYSAGTVATSYYAPERSAQVIPILSVFFSLVSYVADILFAKKCFKSFDSDDGEVIGYGSSTLVRRATWLLNSLMTMSFVRTVLIAVLDAVLNSKLIARGKKFLDRNGVFANNKKIRDTVLVLLVGSVTFNLYVNALRFQWSYSDEGELTTTLLVLMWLTLLGLGDDGECDTESP